MSIFEICIKYILLINEGNYTLQLLLNFFHQQIKLFCLIKNIDREAQLEKYFFVQISYLQRTSENYPIYILNI